MSADGGAGISDQQSVSSDNTAFECPYCGTFIGPRWEDLGWIGRDANRSSRSEGTRCLACGGYLISLGGRVVYPSGLVGPAASIDMPELVRTEYDEARKVGAASPRAAAALLRLAIQKLVDQLKPGKEDLNLKIGLLVDEGPIRPKLANMLDVVRVTGNNAVHPGTMDLTDEPERVITLFKLVNAIVEQTITLDQIVEEAHASLPEGAREGIAKRPAKVQKLREKATKTQ